MRFRREPRVLPGDSPVDSRWWYWVAAVPVAFAFWLASAAWVAVGTALDPGLAAGVGFESALGLALVAMGVPLLVLLVVFPAAVHFDARAVAEQSAWRPNRSLAALALVAPLLAAAAVAAVVLDAVAAVPGSVAAVTLGYLAATPVAGYYLYRRRARVGLL
jgi:heme/copper-type cytochrome/quinol oxidase subunit 2